MLTLRFQRQGKKRDFVFRVIAVDSKITVNSGKSKEILGWWDPRIDKFELKKERILYWISQGAQPSDSCYNLLVRAKIIEGKKRPINIRKKKEKKGRGGPEEKPTEEKPEEKIEEKPVEEIKDEVKIEEKPVESKLEDKPEEKVKEEKKKEVKEKKKEEPRAEEAKESKEEIKEEVKEEIKEESKTEQIKE